MFPELRHTTKYGKHQRSLIHGTLSRSHLKRRVRRKRNELDVSIGFCIAYLLLNYPQMLHRQPAVRQIVKSSDIINIKLSDILPGDILIGTYIYNLKQIIMFLCAQKTGLSNTASRNKSLAQPYLIGHQHPIPSLSEQLVDTFNGGSLKIFQICHHFMLYIPHYILIHD